MKKLVIIGAGGHCRSVLSAAQSMKLWQDFKIIDLNFTNQNEKIIGYKVYPIEKVNEYIKRKLDFFIAIGDNKIRESTYRSMEEHGCSFVNIIHPNSHIDENSNIGKGNFIGQFSNIGACARLGNFNIWETTILTAILFLSLSMLFIFLAKENIIIKTSILISPGYHFLFFSLNTDIYVVFLVLLLINGRIVNTIHPLINRAEEEIKLDLEVISKINQLIDLVKANKKNYALKIFHELIDKYR